VYEAIRALERIGLLTWMNRIQRVREAREGLFGKASAWRWRVVRTSNAYALTDPWLISSIFRREPPLKVVIGRDDNTEACWSLIVFR
jgi:hypothetical protein